MRTTVPSTTSPCLKLLMSESCSASSSSIVVGSGPSSRGGAGSSSLAAGASAVSASVTSTACHHRLRGRLGRRRVVGLRGSHRGSVSAVRRGPGALRGPSATAFFQRFRSARGRRAPRGRPGSWRARRRPGSRRRLGRRVGGGGDRLRLQRGPALLLFGQRGGLSSWSKAPEKITNGLSEAQAVSGPIKWSVVIDSAVRSFVRGNDWLVALQLSCLSGPGESSTGRLAVTIGYDRPTVPELPDLTVVAEAFHAALAGRPITAATALAPLAVRGTPAELDGLVGQQVASIRRRGKFLVIDLDRDAVVINPMLTGRFQLAGPGVKHPRPRRPWCSGSGRGRAVPRMRRPGRPMLSWRPTDEALVEVRYLRSDADGQGLPTTCRRRSTRCQVSVGPDPGSRRR